MRNLTLLNLPESEAAILERLVNPNAKNLPVSVARHILRMKFSKDDVARINELSAKAREGSLSPAEDDVLGSYLRVGHFLSMMKSKSRMALKRTGRTA